MSTEKIAIKNRHGLKLVIQVEAPANPKNLVFIAHGQGGFMGQVHIQAFADVYLANNFRVVRFDATHALGESEGDIIDVTYTSYIEDLEDVINWARTQPWFQQPFSLCGHSMGAQSTAWYAEHHPAEVASLATMAPVVNYDLYINTLDSQEVQGWKAKGYKETVSRSKPGVKKRIGWGVNESLKKFDIVPGAPNLIMPVLDVVGESDDGCPYEHQQIFMDAVASKDKKLVQIAGLEHSYRDNKTLQYDEKLNRVKNALNTWLKSLNT